MSAIYATVLGKAFAAYFDNSLVNYILAAFTGLAVFHFFASATSQALRSIVVSGPLLNKIHIPVSVFPTAEIVANCFQFALSTLPLLAAVTIWQTGSLGSVLMLVYPIVALVLMSAGVGYFLSAAFVFFRDIPYFYELLVYSLRIASPVFYPVDIAPEQVRPFILANPLSQVIVSVRKIALTQEALNPNEILATLIGSALVAVLGWACFYRLRPHFMDLL